MVVGAHGALGSACVRAAAAEGATLVLLGRRVPKLNRLYDSLVSAGHTEPALYPLDLEGAGPADYERMAAAIHEGCGRLDGIIHAAAEFKGLVAFGSIPPEDLVRSLHVNVTAPMLLTQACLPLLMQSPDAAVLVAVDDPQRCQKAYWGAYPAAQAARASWAVQLGDELENTPIRVHALQPGPMRTPLRGKAYFSEDPGQWPEAAAYATDFVAALASGEGQQRAAVRALKR
nr:SDR family NAD(P)-dependent oxidoreductase [Lysobacter sp. CAU 1642]